MKRYRVYTGADSEAIKAAADAIRRGELVIFPTETVYGLAADALNPDAVARVLEAKGRATGHPLPVQVCNSDELSSIAAEVPEAARRLAKRFWPGPLTMVLRKRPSISAVVSGGTDTVGVRIPDHPIALALLTEVAGPVVATSANLTAEQPATTAGQAIDALGDKVAVVLDAGESAIGVASTVVDMTVDPPVVLRHGAITEDTIMQILAESADA